VEWQHKSYPTFAWSGPLGASDNSAVGAFRQLESNDSNSRSWADVGADMFGNNLDTI
jgi:hypothetical protein